MHAYQKLGETGKRLAMRNHERLESQSEGSRNNPRKEYVKNSCRRIGSEQEQIKEMRHKHGFLLGFKMFQLKLLDTRYLGSHTNRFKRVQDTD